MVDPHTLTAMNAWTYGELLADGLSPNQIRDSVQAGALHRVARGLYIEGASPPPLVPKLHALRSLLPADALFGFHTAAQLHGFGVVPSDRVHVLTPAGTPFPQIRGVAAHQSVLPIQGEPVEVDDLPCVPPERCAIDLARTCRRLDAIAVVDAALRATACTSQSLAVELSRHDGLRGVRQARDVVPLADPRPECRQESQLRLVLIDGGLPPPEPQLWVFDDWDEPIFRLDLGYRERRVGAEYDGRSHADRARMRADRRRHNWLASKGWSMRYFTDADLYRRPAYIVSTMRAALDLPR